MPPAEAEIVIGELDRLNSKNARLLEALKKYANMTGNIDDRPDDYACGIFPTAGEIRAARAAIAEAEKFGNMGELMEKVNSEMEILKVVVPRQDGGVDEFTPEEFRQRHQEQPAAVIANLTRKLGDAINALRMITTHNPEDGQCDNGYSPKAIAMAAIAPYGPGPMIQERPRPEE